MIDNDPNETGWLQTYTGRKFYPLRPCADDLDIRDIAHALSNICRYTGHCSHFLSVAEHSINVANQLPSRLRLAGLLHDAAEAYLCDLPRPLKRLPEFAAIYRAAEYNLERVIAGKFNLAFPPDDLVGIADNRMLATEAAQVMAPLHPEWIQIAEPYPGLIIEGWQPELAESRFLRMYESLVS